MTPYLLCDIVSFGKINIKNLTKIQNIVKGDTLEKAAKDFTKTSKLKYSDSLADTIHDGLIHKKITPSVSKYIPKTTTKSKKDYLPINLGKNPGDYNNALEDIAVGIHGSPRDARLSSHPERHIIGRAIRKKKLSAVEKIMTADPYSAEMYKLQLLKEKPTKNTVRDYIQEIREVQTDTNNWKPSRFTPKQRGAKPQSTTIENKKENLRKRYVV